ncbi:protein-tyrosine phosphatase family protein [Fodinibius salsisoli]|uniref:Tyrosine-protein phosphatase n=1 Tax=Fodinibius salsisoli TaxID=2820877 RepID=A0ABT3PKT0_9BACT|nr:tyrosine-protein phosphatase [Fodinibius salsisoli]MCW9706548.1 tyrosine-protein phosphatase [Fodinibius salsisoli]
MGNTIQELQAEIKDWLDDPLKEGIEAALENATTFTSRLQEILKSNPSAGRTLGPLIGKVKGLQKRLNNIEPINWVSISGGHLAIGHRPGSKLISDIRLQGGTHILTLLSESEGAKVIQKEALKKELEWLWLGMSSAEPPSKDRMSEFTSLFDEMINILDNQGRIYLHCSAGIHRTGMISYAFLRYLGYAKEGAQTNLQRLRPTTHEGVGEKRMAWGELFYKR